MICNILRNIEILRNIALLRNTLNIHDTFYLIRNTFPHLNLTFWNSWKGLHSSGLETVTSKGFQNVEDVSANQNPFDLITNQNRENLAWIE